MLTNITVKPHNLNGHTVIEGYVNDEFNFEATFKTSADKTLSYITVENEIVWANDGSVKNTISKAVFSEICGFLNENITVKEGGWYDAKGKLRNASVHVAY